MNETVTAERPQGRVAVVASGTATERARVEERWRDRLTRWRYRYWPDHALGEILAKRWMETAIPVKGGLSS